MLPKILTFQKQVKADVDLEKWRLDYWNDSTKKVRLACEQKSYPEKTLSIVSKIFEAKPEDFDKSYDYQSGCWKFMLKYLIQD